MSLPGWLSGVPIHTRCRMGNSGSTYDDELTFEDNGVGFEGRYRSIEGDGEIIGISAGQHPEGGIQLTFRWRNDDRRWSGEETLWIWREDGQICVWGAFTAEETGQNRWQVGQEWAPRSPAARARGSRPSPAAGGTP